jgi:uncharacterized protein (DUF1800 family)
MSLTADQVRLAHIALNRFGLGAKPGAIARIGSNAKAALLAELDKPGIALIERGTLPTYAEACKAHDADFSTAYGIKERELSARIRKHTQPEIGFVERLVLFFANHFSMSIWKTGAVLTTLGQLERDVIRPNVLGSFKTMLIGVMRHPAMIAYLDNVDSIGPHSPIGQSWGVGLNHNLAREILELHTVGVHAGYTEADIAALASIITGWSYVRGWEADGGYNGGNASNRGQFIYRSNWHEPGSQRLLGKSYQALGARQGVNALADLALHPSTAQFLAFKLVRHFLTDTPTPTLVNPVAKAYLASGGNLKETAKALINLPYGWKARLRKLRTPYELQIAQMRALGRRYDPADRWPFDATLDALRHRPWERPTPDGFPEDTAYWMGPDAMRIRLETAQMTSWALQQLGPISASPATLATQLFGAYLSPSSRSAVAQAPSITDGLATLFMIPEFQRR